MNILQIAWLDYALLTALMGSLWVSRQREPVRAFGWGLAFTGASLACTVLAMVRWARVERAMRERRPLPAFSTGFILAGSLIVICLLLGFSLVS